MNIYIEVVKNLSFATLIVIGFLLIAVPTYYLFEKYFNWISKKFHDGIGR